jgi:hypothetical protein
MSGISNGSGDIDSGGGDGYACGEGLSVGDGYGFGEGSGTGNGSGIGECDGYLTDTEYGWGYGIGSAPGGGSQETGFCGTSRDSEFRGDCAMMLETVYSIRSYQIVESRFYHHTDYRFTREEAEAVLAMRVLLDDEC